MQDVIRTGPPRLSDVAIRAGVSTATVSRTLSRPDLVSQATRDAVMRAVDETGYRMNHTARSLRRQQTGMVVALVPNLANPFFSRILAAMGETLDRAGKALIVADTRPAEGRPPSLEAFLNPTRSDGVILLDGSGDPGPGDLRPPMVMACEWIDGSGLPAVAADNTSGARQAIAHLAGLGHRTVAVIGGPEGNVLTRDRMAGAEAAAREAGVALTRLTGDFGLDSGVTAARAYLALPDRPTGVFAFSDAMACGFLAAVQRAGLRVPADLSVIGFDDIDIAPHLLPALTTIHQPREAIGACAAQTVLALAAGEAPPGRQVLPVRLVIRASTGPAPRR